MNNVSEITKEQCTGCSACVFNCPFECITMQPDNEGYLYPTIDEKTCTDCGICIDKCPSNPLNETLKNSKISNLYATWIKDDSVRSISSSGGAFSAFAHAIINKGGYVCGVAFNSTHDSALHILTNEENKLDAIRRSKFLQSNKVDVFKKIESFLKNNLPVLFTGCPCEIAGLQSYLGKSYDKLITCDIICGCVSSPKVYKSWINSLENRFESKVVSVNFKDKRKGWKAKGVSVVFENGKEYLNGLRDDDYVVSFHSRFNIRPSCFSCKYASTNRVSDLTIGDFWGISAENPNLDDDKGTSFVLSNTSKGNSLLMETSKYMNIHKLEINLLEYSKKYNSRINSSPDNPIPIEVRQSFYNECGTIDFELLAQKYLAEIKRKRKEYFESLNKK